MSGNEWNRVLSIQIYVKCFGNTGKRTHLIFSVSRVPHTSPSSAAGGWSLYARQIRPMQVYFDCILIFRLIYHQHRLLAHTAFVPFKTVLSMIYSLSFYRPYCLAAVCMLSTYGGSNNVPYPQHTMHLLLSFYLWHSMCDKTIEILSISLLHTVSNVFQHLPWIGRLEHIDTKPVWEALVTGVEFDRVYPICQNERQWFKSHTIRGFHVPLENTLVLKLL